MEQEQENTHGDKNKFMYWLGLIVLSVIFIFRFARHFVDFKSVAIFKPIMAIILSLGGIVMVFAAFEKYDWLTDSFQYAFVKEKLGETTAQFLNGFIGLVLIILGVVIWTV